MGSERATTVMESWLGGLWHRHKDLSGSEKEVIGILSLEVVSLMSKVVRVWRGLSDLEILRLKAEIFRSAGLRNLVSKDENSLMAIVRDEILETVVYVARAVIRFGKRCLDPVYRQIERLFVNPLQHRAEWSGWAYKWKKMERRAKKMERFIGAMIQLFEEREDLEECEQILRRLKANPKAHQGKVFEFQQKVMRRRQAVRNLRELSPWCRSYDYITRLLLRSISTILEKMAYTFGGSQESSSDGERNLYMCHSKHSSIPALVPSISPPDKIGYHQFFSTNEKNMHLRNLSQVAPFKGCMVVATDSPITRTYKTGSGGSANPVGGDNMGDWKEDNTRLFFASSEILWRLGSLYSKRYRFSLPRGTLVHAVMAVHYANIIVRIEKLACSPNLVRLDLRDDLYEMLPFSMKAALRTRLRPLIKEKSTAGGLDPAEEEKHRSYLVHTLGWICPLAHDTIKWYSEQGFEKHVPGCAANVLMVQTLYFANQAKTEAAIVQLLVSLSLLSKGGR